jgi:8-hydroxy-5-deazaflavin:NADPH oxidoreductase
MKIAVVGRGNIGGGLADKWERAGHSVTRIGRDGGNVSDAEAVLLAVPGDAVEDAFGRVSGLEGKTVIDATNLFDAPRPSGFNSNAEFVKSRTNGPTAKSFNTNYAALYDQVEKMSVPPGNLWCGDEEARDVVEQLNRDAGFEPIPAGGLEKARILEDFLKLSGGVREQIGRFFYRMAPPDEF